MHEDFTNTKASEGIGMEALPETQQQTLEQIAELISRAKTGDPTAMPEIRELLKTAPSLFQTLGDIAGNALVSWIRRYAGDDLIQAEAVGMQMDQLRDELTEPADNALERLLIRQIVLTQLMVNYSAAVLAQTGSTHLSTLRYLDTRLEKTTRRLTHLAKMLELLRKSRRKTASPKTIGPTAKQNGRPLVPESRFPTFGVNNRIRELVGEAG